jgi:hypothetical protein
MNCLLNDYSRTILSQIKNNNIKLSNYKHIFEH